MTDPFEPPRAPAASEVVEYVVGLTVEQQPRSFLDTGGSYVVPSFEPRCVCCNTATGETKAYDPGESNQLTASFDVPVCIDCYDHVAGGRFWSGMLALAGGIGGVLVLVGVFAWAAADAGPGALSFGIAGVSIAASGYWIGTWRAVVSARNGHHTMFEAWVHPGFTGVRTTNRQLVDDLLAHHPETGAIQSETPR
ncbi:MAG: hypothetical protein KC912_10575 [Proteobacteria bacterium]|nr:hypothetical protein [Pseudomonadota bacterium]